MPARLRELYHTENYRVVILSNQGGLTLHPDPHAKTKGPKNLGKDRVAKFKQKCGAVLAQLDIPTSVYAATGRDLYRKPRAGMWDEVCEDYDIAPGEVDRERSVFVGDAGGRTAVLVQGGGSSGGGGSNAKKPAVAKDFSCSDRNFAHNVGVSYQTPEEYFLGEAPREFVRDFDVAAFPFSRTATSSTDSGKGSSSNNTPVKNEASKVQKEEEEEDGENDDNNDDDDDDIIFTRKNAQELVLFCGPPGAGKSTFYRRYLQRLGYARVNQDALKTRAKCMKAAADHLGEGAPVAVDNTNPDEAGRREWVELARKHGVPARCVWFRTGAALCEHNDVVRALNREVCLFCLPFFFFLLLSLLFSFAYLLSILPFISIFFLYLYCPLIMIIIIRLYSTLFLCMSRYVLIPEQLKQMNPEARTALPKLAFNTFFARFKEPTVKEGFEDVVAVDFKFRGSREEYEIWGRYWT